jgi:hypothetical protein
MSKSRQIVAVSLVAVVGAAVMYRYAKNIFTKKRAEEISDQIYHTLLKAIHTKSFPDLDFS